VPGITAIVFYNTTSISESCTLVFGLRGSVFTRLEELEAAAAGVSPSRRRKNVERSKLHIEKFRQASSQKSEKS
jgi:hypothetical protein